MHLLFIYNNVYKFAAEPQYVNSCLIALMVRTQLMMSHVMVMRRVMPHR